MTPARLAKSWRAYADKLAPYGEHHDEVQTLRRCATELDAHAALEAAESDPWYRGVHCAACGDPVQTARSHPRAVVPCDCTAPRMTGRKLAAVVVVAALVVAWSCCHGCSDDAAPAFDAAAELPACAELPGCDVAHQLCTAASVCQCRRPGLPPVECRR